MRQRLSSRPVTRSGQTGGAVATEKEQYDAYVGQIARGAGMSSMGQGIGRLLGYATQVALARMFGPAQLGFYVLGLSLVQLVNILSMFGMNDGAVRFVARYRAEGDISRVRGTILTVLGTTFALSLALSGLMYFGAGFLAGFYGKPFLESTFRAFSLSVPFFGVMSVSLWATQGFQTVKYATYVEHVLRPLINFGLIVAFYLLGVEILGAITAYILSMAAGCALALYYLKRLFPKLLDRTTPAKYEPRELFGASAPMMVVTTTNYVNGWATVAILGVLAPARDVGIFNAANRTAALTGLALLAFSGIFSPMISALYRQGSLEHLGYLYKDVSRWNFTGSLAIFLLTALLSRDILAVFGEQFVPAWPALVVISGAQLFSSSVGLTGRVLAMTGYQKLVMWTRLGAAVTTVAAGLALVPLYGVMGAAVAAAAGLILANVITLFSVERLLGFWPYSRRYLNSLAAGLVASGTVWLLQRTLPLPEGVPTLLVLGAVFAATFAATIAALRLSDSDRQFLAAFWAAVRRNVGRGR